MGSKIPEAKLVSGKKTTALNYEKNRSATFFVAHLGAMRNSHSLNAMTDAMQRKLSKLPHVFGSKK
ncbi:hypothetical protein [Modicisalibacter luteus]|uniref:hypothetical protein n=1 Tax=Modicisalibacter luteus TaxID=453962 RepID=UPI0036339AF7